MPRGRSSGAGFRAPRPGASLRPFGYKEEDTMALFPSQQFLDELVKLLNESKEYEQAAKNWEGGLTLIVEADDKVPHEYYAYIEPYHGKIKEALMLSRPDERQAAFVLSGPYTAWKDVVLGRQDAVSSLMKGKLRLKEGKMAALLKNVKASQITMKTMQRIPTEFVA
jgi:putative sterol carrier protein